MKLKEYTLRNVIEHVWAHRETQGPNCYRIWYGLQWRPELRDPKAFKA